MKYLLHTLALAALTTAPACVAPTQAPPAASLTFGFVSGEFPVTGEGLSLRVEVLNADSGSLGTLLYDIPTKTTLTGAAQGLANQLRDRLGVASRVVKEGPEKDAPVTLSLEGGYRFGNVYQRHNKGSAIFTRGSVMRVRRTNG